MKALDVALVCRKSEHMGDWYLIERAEHDGREWLEETEHGGSLQCSARICDADIEGPLYEMVTLARMIKRGETAFFGRCAAQTTPAGVLLWSPRNSDEPTLVTRERALDLAAQILTITTE